MSTNRIEIESGATRAPAAEQPKDKSARKTREDCGCDGAGGFQASKASQLQ